MMVFERCTSTITYNNWKYWIYLIKGPVEEKLLPALSVPIEVEVPLLLAIPLLAILEPSVFFIDCVKAACSD
jgi:hypothetical protein